MEFLVVLLPFLICGFFAALISRFTGVALSFFLVPTILMLGANPLEVVTFMLTFILYNNFTMETQDVRLDLKTLTFFPGYKGLIPVAITVLLGFVSPFLAIAVFFFCFILELCAFAYKHLEERQRPEKKDVVKHAMIASIASVLGVLVVPLIPESYYFILAGAAILCLTAFAWYAGKHRNAFRGSWAYLWSGFSFLLGLFGVECSNYTKDLRRQFPSKIDSFMPLIYVFGSYTGLILCFALYAGLSLPSLMAAIGSAISIRIFGVYEFTGKGAFSYTATATAILMVVLLYLINPTPVGFTTVNEVFGTMVK